MKTVLLTWELGAGFGHVGPLLRLARELKRRGHRPVFALRDVVGPRPLIADFDAPVLQAPRWLGEGFLQGRPFRLSSYADVLAVYGFADAESLGALTASWDALLGYVKPDLIVADHSPALCLAAHGSIPVAVIGNGYTVPPVNSGTFPPLYSDRPPLMAEGRLLENVREVQRRRGRPAPPTLPALFDAPLRAVGAIPELDPYRNVRREPVLGPLEEMPPHSRAPETPRLFAYLGEEHPALETIAQALADVPCEREVYLRGSVGHLRHFLTARGVKVHAAPPPLADAVSRASAVISHAGSTTAHAALLAGRPQVLFPTHIEADLTADSLVSLQVGVKPPPKAGAAEFKEIFRTACGDGALRDRAGARARDAANAGRPDGAAAAAAACLRLLS